MKTRTKRHQRILALYHGEDYIYDGTAEELGDRIGVSAATIVFYATNSYHRRLENGQRNEANSYIAVRIGWDDDDDF